PMTCEASRQVHVLSREAMGSVQDDDGREWTDTARTRDRSGECAQASRLDLNPMNAQRVVPARTGRHCHSRVALALDMRRLAVALAARGGQGEHNDQGYLHHSASHHL